MNIPAMAMTPKILSTGTLGEQAPPGTVEYGTNQPVRRGVGARYRVEFMPLTGETMWQPEEPQVVTAQTAGGISRFNKQSGESMGQLPGAVPSPYNTPFRYPNASGQVETNTYANMQAGGAPRLVPDAVDPRLMIDVSTQRRFLRTEDANGNSILQEVTVPTERRKVAPGSQAPPPVGPPTLAPSASSPAEEFGDVVPPSDTGYPGFPMPPKPSTTTAAPPPVASAASGGRQFRVPFTPLQQLTETQRLATFNQAIDRMDSVKSRLGLLNSLIDSGKMEFMLESDEKGNHYLNFLVKRAVGKGMTDDEKQLVADMNTMVEDVNMIRLPLGAGGFRGPEAWAGLQRQKGNLLQDPDITRKVIDNTLVAFRAQRDPLQERFGKRQPPGTPAPGTPPPGAPGTPPPGTPPPAQGRDDIVRRLRLMK
jgi:hypothetical protein